MMQVWRFIVFGFNVELLDVVYYTHKGIYEYMAWQCNNIHVIGWLLEEDIRKCLKWFFFYLQVCIFVGTE